MQVVGRGTLRYKDWLCVFINQVCECYSLSTAAAVQSPWTPSDEIFLVTAIIVTKQTNTCRQFHGKISLTHSVCEHKLPSIWKKSQVDFEQRHQAFHFFFKPFILKRDINTGLGDVLGFIQNKLINTSQCIKSALFGYPLSSAIPRVWSLGGNQIVEGEPSLKLFSDFHVLAFRTNKQTKVN